MDKNRLYVNYSEIDDEECEVGGEDKRLNREFIINIITDREILQLFLDTQEWQTFECKRAAVQPRKLLETVVAFANSDGGFLVIGLEDPRKSQTVDKYLNEHYRITNSEARRITGVSDTLKMSRLLKSWVTKGLLEKMGTGFRGNVYYRKPGTEMPSGIFKKLQK